MLTRFDLTFNAGNAVITLEEESIQICNLWRSLLRYSFGESEMTGHIIAVTTSLYQTFVNIICKENKIEPFIVDEGYVKKMAMSDIIAPITYERVVTSPLFSKYSEVSK